MMGCDAPGWGQEDSWGGERGVMLRVYRSNHQDISEIAGPFEEVEDLTAADLMQTGWTGG